MTKRNYLFLALTIFIFSCTKTDLKEPQSPVMVKIGDVTISKDEFIRRAEYTIRPEYCKNNYNIHKKIILNSLIAEKLFALEANGDSLVHESEYLSNYITGRKNQSMRQLHYYNEGTQKVEVDKEELNRIYNQAGRKYKLAFLNLPGVTMAEEFLKFIEKENITFQEGIKEFTGNENLPVHEVDYATVENSEIHNILYNSEINKSKIYGPIKTHAGNAVLFQVLAWTDAKVITDSQIKMRYNDVREKVTRIKADKIYSEYVSSLMKGKKLDFNRETFFRLAALYRELYAISSKNKKELLNQEMWGRDLEMSTMDSLHNAFDDLKNSVLFTLDGKTWTVEKFQEELDTHPLVFRKKNIKAQEFPGQFRLAVADLVRDKFITEDAYKKGYDKLNTVQDYTAMWRDNAISLFYREKYLKENNFDGIFSENYMKAINQHLNPLVDSLQNKYSDKIYIDTEIFNDIELTRIDLFAIQNNVPYPVAVPAFPVITTDDRLDYGKKMNP